MITNKLKVIYTIFVFIIIIFAITNHVNYYGDSIKNEPIKNNKTNTINKKKIQKSLYKASENIEILSNIFLTVLDTQENFITNIDHKQLKEDDKILRINIKIVNNNKYNTHIGEFRAITDNNKVLSEHIVQYDKNYKIKPNTAKEISLYYVYNEDQQKVNGITLIYDNNSLVEPNIFNIDIDFKPIEGGFLIENL
jgi:hypothetical protein